MRWKTITLGLLLLAAAADGPAIHAASVSTAAATPAPVKLNAAEVPVDAKWIIYMNFDQAMANPAAGKMLTAFLRTHPQAKKNINKLEKVMGAKFPQDFHNVLLLGRNVGPNHGVVVIHANARQNRIKKFLKASSGNVEVTTPANGIYEMVDKKGRKTYEASPSRGTFVVSRSEKALNRELLVLAGTSAAMAANNPLLAGTRHGVVMYMADTDMTQLANHHARRHPGPDWMKSVTGAWLAVNVKKEKLNIQGRIDLIDANTAAQMVQMAQGWQAMMDLGATSANVKPRQRFIAGIADRLNVGAIGKVIRIHWTMSLTKLLAGPQKRAAATQ